MPKIVAVCPKEYPGVSAVFKHGARLKLWEHSAMEEVLPPADLVILGAWHPYYEEYVKKHTCVVYLTSTFGQMEHSAEQVEFKNLERIYALKTEKSIKAILAGSKDVATFLFNKDTEKTIHCPYPFSEDLIRQPELGKIKNSVGLFLPNSPRKNIANQVIAAGESEVILYTNLPEAGKKIINTGWLTDEEYYALISELWMTLHCTFTESFSYAAAESLMLGTIPIVSLQVAENLNLPPGSTCFQCDSVSEILELIEYIKELSEEEYKKILRMYQEKFRILNEENLEETKKVLDTLTKKML